MAFQNLLNWISDDYETNSMSNINQCHFYQWINMIMQESVYNLLKNLQKTIIDQYSLFNISNKPEWYCHAVRHTVMGSVGSSCSIDCPLWKRKMRGGSLTGSMLTVIISVALAGGISGSLCSSYIVILIYSTPEQSWHGV